MKYFVSGNVELSRTFQMDHRKVIDCLVKEK